METALTAQKTYDLIFDKIDLQNESIPQLLKAQADTLDAAMKDEATLKSIDDIGDALNTSFNTAIDSLKTGLEEFADTTFESPKVTKVVKFDIPNKLYESNKSVTAAANESVKASAQVNASNQKLLEAIEASSEKDKTINLQITYDESGKVKSVTSPGGVVNVTDALL